MKRIITLLFIGVSIVSFTSCGGDENGDSSAEGTSGIDGTWTIKKAEGAGAELWLGLPVEFKSNTMSMNQADPCPYTMSGDTLINTCTTYLNGDKSQPWEVTDKYIIKQDGNHLSMSNVVNGQKFELEKN